MWCHVCDLFEGSRAKADLPRRDLVKAAHLAAAGAYSVCSFCILFAPKNAEMRIEFEC